jgi:caa(3)-type oxidase subunit IV
MSESHHPNYKKIYFTLLFLLVVSVAGPFLGILWVTLITAFGIALVKANLVIQNFMHLRWEKGIMKWTLATSLILMFLLFAGVAPDVMKHEGTRWVNDAAIAAVERGIEGSHGEEEAHVVAAEEHADEAAVPEESAAPAVAAAQEFDAAGAYQTVCALCHGATGAGDGPGGAALDPKPASFADAAFWADRTDEQVALAISGGGAAVGKSALMPAWGAMYNEGQVAAMVTFLKTFQSGG